MPALRMNSPFQAFTSIGPIHIPPSPTKRHRPHRIHISHRRFKFHSLYALLPPRVAMTQLHGADLLSSLISFLSLFSVSYDIFLIPISRTCCSYTILVPPSYFSLSWCDPLQSHSSSAPILPVSAFIHVSKDILPLPLSFPCVAFR